MSGEPRPVDVIILRILEIDPSPDYGELRIAAPGRSPDERVAVWDGLPPFPVPDHESVAPVVLAGDLDGRQAYAERVPRGVRLSEVRPPADLMDYVVGSVLRALAHLHAHSQVHGSVTAARVVLGTDGSVVLFGRGRRGGIAASDAIAAFNLLPTEETTLPTDDAAILAEELLRVAPVDARRRLAELAAREHTERRVLEQRVLTLGVEDMSMDEVVPDLGPDSDAEAGILDRWAVTTASGVGEPTGELLDGGSGRQQLGVTLWSRLASPVEHSPPRNRFHRVAGVPSRGVRTLLVDDPPDTVPVPLTGTVRPFFGSEAVDDPHTPNTDDHGLDGDETLHGVDPPTMPQYVVDDTAVKTQPYGMRSEPPAEPRTHAPPPASRVPVVTGLLAAVLFLALMWLVLQVL